MRRSSLLISGLIPCALCASAPALAAPTVGGPVSGGVGGGVTQPAPSQGRLDPRFTLLRAAIERHGRQAPIFGPEGLDPSVPLDRVGASLRFSDLLSPAAIRLLEAEGVRFHRRDGEVRHVGAVYPAQLTWRALDHLAQHPGLIRAEASWRPLSPQPLEITGLEAGTAQARWRTDDPTDGAGVIVATIDSGVDVLHPHFFRADGPWFDWVDVDGDGQLDLGTDGVDYDGDGEISDGEILRVLDAGTLGFGFSGSVDGLDNALQPRRDWLYLDQNQDRRRGVGLDDGFTEQDPAYGEPLFVADDVNGNDRLDPGEKIVQLMSSKVDRLVYGEQIFTRGGAAGAGLIDAVKHPVHEGSFHGTGVASIILGGQAGFHDRIGMAPGASLISYAPYDPGNQSLEYEGQALAIDDALQRGATLIVHEWTDPFFVPQDGSTNLEAAMDAARNAGLIQVNPLGNLNVARKHAIRAVGPGDQLSLGFDVGPGFNNGAGLQPYTVAYSLLMWREDHPLTVAVRMPFSANTVDLPLDGQYHNISGDIWGQAFWDTTRRGTRYALVFIFVDGNNAQGKLTEGAWSLEIGGFSQADTVHARIADYYSSWGVGIAWEAPDADASTAVFPSTADSALGVAAFGGRHDIPDFDQSRAGELRNYSGRGPRIDGAAMVDITAPDDPYAAMPATADALAAGYGRSWFSTFGGTSGAGPHVAGALALMAAHTPDVGASTLEDRLIAAVQTEDLVPDLGPLPNAHWGHGRLDAYQAIYGERAPTPDQRPDLQVEIRVTEGEVIFDPSGSSDPEGGALKVRYDLDYDGEWDGEQDGGWRDLTPYALPRADLQQPGLAKIQLRDPSGASAGALIAFDPTTITPSQPDAGVSTPDASVDGGPADNPSSGGPNASPSAGGEDDGGCNCDAGRGGSAPWALLALAGLLRRRRRR